MLQSDTRPLFLNRYAEYIWVAMMVVIGVVPLVIGYFYSLWHKPVLQYPVLFFSFPFLLMAVFALLQQLPRYIVWGAVLAIIVLNTFSLIQQRQHYYIMTHQPFDTFIDHTARFADSLGEHKLTAIANVNRIYLDYYNERLSQTQKVDYQTIYNDTSSNTYWKFERSIQQLNTPYLAVAHLPDSYISAARQHFPYVHYYEEGFTYSYFLLARHPATDTLSGFFRYTLKSPKALPDTLAGEWGAPLSLPVDSLHADEHTLLDAVLRFSGEDPGKAVLVATVERDDNTFLYQTSPLQPVYNYNSTHEETVYTLCMSFRLPATVLNTTGARLKVYVWNRDERQLLQQQLILFRRPGNPYRYGLFKDF